MHTSNETFPSSPDNVFASFDFNPIAEGSRFDVYKGYMFIANNYESKEKAVVKASRSSHASQDFWDPYLEVLELASHTATKFRQLCHENHKQELALWFPKCYASSMETTTKLNTFFGFFKGTRKHIKHDEYVLIEPHIDGHFGKYIDCNGEVLAQCPEYLQAFTHFSYHDSGQELVICGLKGSLSDGHYNLTVPWIHSKSKKYGHSDQGEDGIRRFFSRHFCNDICASFSKPS